MFTYMSEGDNNEKKFIDIFELDDMRLCTRSLPLENQQYNGQRTWAEYLFS